jgi:hypothetical protein
MLHFPSTQAAYEDALKVLDAEDDPYGIEVYVFPQTWGSTALGFGGVGGCAMTSAYTTVVICGNQAAVYFGARLAYKVTNPTPKFFDDLAHRNMRELGRNGGYSGKEHLPD